jgi:hypothetical protein
MMDDIYELSESFGQAVYQSFMARRYGLKNCQNTMDPDLAGDLLNIKKREQEREECCLIFTEQSCCVETGTQTFDQIQDLPCILFNYTLTISPIYAVAGAQLGFKNQDGVFILYPINSVKSEVVFPFCAEYSTITFNGTPYFAENEPPCLEEECATISGLTLLRGEQCCP